MRDIKYPLLEKVYLVGIDHHCYRAGEPSEIVGIKMGTPNEKDEPRLVYEVDYGDGDTDMVAASDIPDNYIVLTFSDVKTGKIPKVR